MAGQTDNADDLIAELARLMAEDAQSDKPNVDAKPVRIPGDPAPVSPPVASPAAAQPSAVPRFDFVPASEKTVTPSPTIRIPGQASLPVEPRPLPVGLDRPGPQAETPRVESVRIEPKATPQASAPTRQEPSFATETRQEPTIATTQSAPTAPVVVEPEVASQDLGAPLPDLDGDSLADLIAAELATEIAPEDPAVIEDAENVAHEVPVRDNDVFGVPPVFGLGSAQPSQAAPEVAEPSEPDSPDMSVDDIIAQADSAGVSEAPPIRTEPDPLDEIEKLIGPAVRGEQRTPSPALRSLATPTLPVEPAPTPASEKTRTSSLSSVDEAILAAAATSGARVEWVEPEISAKIADIDDEAAPRARSNRVLGMTRSLAGPVVATGLLAVAAIGLYVVLGLGSGAPDGPAPLLVADSAPIKEVPEPDPEASEATQSVVFNEIAGVDRGADEQLVSRDQADIEAVSAFVPSSGNDEGLVNRKVRTVTVRPDGTIVSGSEGVAGATMLPVDRPDVPEVPGADFSTPELIGSVDPSATAAETAAAAAAATATTPTVVPVQPGSFVQAVDAAGNEIVGRTAPVPLTRPSNLPTAAASPVAATTPTATTAAAPAPAAAAPQPDTATPAQSSAVTSAVSSAPAYVQLSSQRTEEAARQTAQTIASRFGPLFGGANLEVQRVDLGDRGIFYRVRVPADSLQSANTLCNNVKAAGGDCFTM